MRSLILACVALLMFAPAAMADGATATVNSAQRATCDDPQYGWAENRAHAVGHVAGVDVQARGGTACYTYSWWGYTYSYSQIGGDVRVSDANTGKTVHVGAYWFSQNYYGTKSCDTFVFAHTSVASAIESFGCPAGDAPKVAALLP